jgi:RNA polymerase subunit RPABC4/transcription elongation factor Spt4
MPVTHEGCPVTIMPTEAPYCWKCGSPIPAKAKFCPTCGTKADETAGETDDLFVLASLRPAVSTGDRHADPPSVVKARSCPDCHRILRDKHKFCPRCGTAAPPHELDLRPRCTSCKRILDNGEKYCPNCGGASGPPEIPPEYAHLASPPRKRSWLGRLFS